MAATPRQSFQYYNEKPDIQFKEYGRNVENLVRFIVKQEDRETRNRLCATLVAMVKKINPSVLQDNQEDLQKFWDHIHFISGLQLDVDGPFPIPEIELLQKKPARLAYPQGQVRLRHYGQNIDLMIEEAIKIQDPEEKKQAAIFIGKMMKNFFTAWNKDNAEDSIIVKQIYQMSQGRLELSLEEVKTENLFDGTSNGTPWKPQPLEEIGRAKKRPGQQNSTNSGRHFKRRRR
jgi:hypothetical protein